MGLLDGKVAIITGASRGIGKAIAEQFIKEGAKVAFTYLSSDEKAKAHGKLNCHSKWRGSERGLNQMLLTINSAQELCDAVVAEFGTVDVLVNNAGITKDNLLMRMTEEQWDEVINTNLKSAFNLTKAVLKPMLKAKKGSIINMSSVVGVSGNAGQANYAASKAGMIGFSKSVAQELGSRNIRCNAIAPGFIETEMTAVLDQNVVQGWRDSIPLKRGGTPLDVANTTVFLASDMSAYVTGQTIHVCGGMLM
jgi:3-oxoacyl-[acyl-carrier protein] reductase